MAQIAVKFTANQDKVTGFNLKVNGVQGEACLLTTAAIARMNKSALLEPTEEMLNVEESQVSIWEANG